MEKEKNNKALYIIVGILCLLVLSLLGYVIYDKALSNKEQINDNDNIKDNSNLQNNLLNDKYKVLNANNKNDTWYDGHYYIVKLNNENIYDIIYDLGEKVHYIGIYNNRIYYSTGIYSSEQFKVYIKYISLYDDNPTETTWLEIPQPNCPKGTIGCSTNELGYSVIVDDTLYFNFSSFSGGSGEYDGLMSLNMNAKAFDEYKSIEKIADVLQGWCINNNNIYYFENYKKLVEHNIINNSKKILLEYGNEADLNYMICDNNKILFNSYVSSLNNPNVVSHHEVYLYNTKDNSNNLITDKIYENFGGGIYSIANIINDKVYYRIDNKIYSYNENDKSSSIFYTANGDIYQFFFLDNNTMKISFTDGKRQYVINGKDVSSIDTVNIKMEDGTIKTYTIDYLK